MMLLLLLSVHSLVLFVLILELFSSLLFLSIPFFVQIHTFKDFCAAFCAIREIRAFFFLK